MLTISQWGYVLLMIIFLVFFVCYDRYTIWQWKKRIHLNHHLNVLKQISMDINGFYLSKQARLQYDAPEYVYGEIDLTAFIALLSLSHLSSDSVFYDLGSGTGKTVLLCAMIFPIKKSCGIELLSPLHQAALIQHERLKKYREYAEKALGMVYIQGNFLDVDFDDATIIYINATAFFGEIWVKINQKIDKLIHCRTVITTTKRLTAASYQLMQITRVQMSWGVVQVFIHTRSKV